MASSRLRRAPRLQIPLEGMTNRHATREAAIAGSPLRKPRTPSRARPAASPQDCRAELEGIGSPWHAGGPDPRGARPGGREITSQIGFAAPAAQRAQCLRQMVSAFVKKGVARHSR
jgi:hypothetical protein